MDFCDQTLVLLLCPSLFPFPLCSGAAEDLVGEFLSQLDTEHQAAQVAAADSGNSASSAWWAKQLQFHTKWVPGGGGAMGVAEVQQALQLSQHRMQSKSLDLVAFHW